MLLTCASVIFAGYCYVVLPRVEAGWQRCIYVAPILVANLYLCCMFDFWADLVMAFNAGFNNVWMQGFKVMGLALGRGLLLLPLSFPQYVAVFCLPVVPMHTVLEKDGHVAVTLTTKGLDTY